MLRSNLPRAVRHLGRRRRWRQADLAHASGISRQAISRIERGVALGSIPLRVIARLTEALDASADLTLRWRGEALDHPMSIRTVRTPHRTTGPMRDAYSPRNSRTRFWKW
jgi:transcriptional regulator with XRE-family HTH domain